MESPAEVEDRVSTVGMCARGGAETLGGGSCPNRARRAPLPTVDLPSQRLAQKSTVS